LPPAELVCDGVDPRTVLFLGCRRAGPPSDGGDRHLPADVPLAPTRIFAYQRNLERICLGEDEMTEELAFALEEELAQLHGRE